jgi:hypothetical protein
MSLPVSDAQRTLLYDIAQFTKDSDGDGWLRLANGFNGYSYQTAQAAQRRGLVEAQKAEDGFDVRLTSEGKAWLERDW